MAIQNTTIYTSGAGASWGITWDDATNLATALFATSLVAPREGKLTYFYTLAGNTTVGTWIAPNAVNTRTTVTFPTAISVFTGLTNRFGTAGLSFGFTLYGGGHGMAAAAAAIAEANRPFAEKWAEHLALMRRIGRVA